MIKQLKSIPTWLLANLMSPIYPKTHPWKYRYFTLNEWATGQTQICKNIDFILWIYMLAWIIWIIYILFTI